MPRGTYGTRRVPWLPLRWASTVLAAPVIVVLAATGDGVSLGAGGTARVLLAGWLAVEFRHLAFDTAARKLHLSRMSLKDGRLALRTADMPDDLPAPHWGVVSPRGETVALAAEDEKSPVTTWMTVDLQAAVVRVAEVQERPLLVWRQDGTTEVYEQEGLRQGMPEGTSMRLEAVEMAGHVYAVACDSYHAYPRGILRFDRSLRTPTWLVDANDVQLLRDSILHVRGWREVIRFWPGQDRRETLFGIPRAQWDVWMGWDRG